MQDFWAWGGKYIGFKSGNYLFSRQGNPIGYFQNEILYDFSGKYLAEICNKDRLITVLSHKHYRAGFVMKPINSCGRNCINYIGNIMIIGCEDFQYKD